MTIFHRMYAYNHQLTIWSATGSFMWGWMARQYAME